LNYEERQAVIVRVLSLLF